MSDPVALIDGEERPIVPLARHHIEALADAGTLETMGRFELLDGVLVRMSPSKSPHGLVLMRLGIHLGKMLEDRFDIGSDIGVFFGDITMRAPDIVVCPRGIEPGFLKPEDVILAIEISASTQDVDLRGKSLLYARSALPEYWVVDLDTRKTYRHRAPSPQGYAQVEAIDWADPVDVLCAPDAAFQVADVLKGVRI